MLLFQLIKEHIDPTAFALIFFRVLGFIVFIPIGSKIASASVKKIALSFGLAFALYFPVTTNGIDVSNIVVFRYFGEFLLGFLMSLPLSLTLNCLEMGGELFDLGRGESIGQMYDPLTSRQGKTMGRFLKYFVWATLLLNGTLELIIATILKSFTIVPLFPIGVEQFLTILPSMGLVIVKFLTGMFIVALPLLLCWLLTDFLIGLFGKSMPRIMLHSEMFQLKTFIGLMLLIIILNYQLIPSFTALITPAMPNSIVANR